ncbi:hypothetical protein E0H26_01560 [Micromonospora zingiberis]|uniref:Uncharacterized protein n=1 Tax=Micromonospora zingiberis TaxID=2053011 RepID=A0A4R0GRE9_9ACTN|nr:hypothetical protein [Micromonospora zingiberis]TCC00405.1 hypothetical protein E0H26_01560 [Micromonospora zingiberis]
MTAIAVGLVCLLVLGLGLVVHVFGRVFEGDTRPTLTNDIVVGTWRGADDCTFTFNADGTFVARNVPVSLFNPPGTTAPADVARGEWELTAAIEDPGGRLATVQLGFETVGEQGQVGIHFSTRLRSNTVDGEPVLYWFNGDPDLNRRFILEKD